MAEADHAQARRLAKRRHYRIGMAAEWLAVALMFAKGYRLVGRRIKTRSGEIDLIMVRGRRISFIEVKWRPTLEAAQSAIADAQRRRVRRAADSWLSRNRRYVDHDMSFDVIFVMPWKLPQHIVGGL